MRILKYYVLKLHLTPFFLSLIVFTFILLLSKIFDLTEMLMQGGLTVTRIFPYIPLFSLAYTLPMSVLTATLVAFSKLVHEHEIIAIKAAGINLLSLIFPVILIGGLLSLIAVNINNQLVPHARHSFEELLKDIGIRKPVLLFPERVFIEDFPGYYIWIDRRKGTQLRGIKIMQLQGDRLPSTIIAREGEIDSTPEDTSITLRLFNGTKEETGEKLKISHFQSFDLNLALTQQTKQRAKRPKEMTDVELKQKIASLKEKSIDVFPLLTELKSRNALAFASLTFMLIGIPLSISTQRGGKSLSVGLSLVLIIIYYLLLLAGQVAGEKGIIHPSWAVWTPNILLGAIGITLITRVAKN